MPISELNKNKFTKSFRILQNQKGFAAFYTTALIMVVVFALALSIFVLTHNEQKIAQNIIKSSQTYYAAEAGIEDALMRLSKNPLWSKDVDTSYQLEADGAITTVTVTKIIGGSRIITSQGNAGNRIRKIEVAYEVRADKISFRYGAQVDEGGAVMYNNSKIKGNIFSNGSIIKGAGGGGEITGDAILASTSTAYGNNKISGLEIGANAYAYSCDQNSTIGGKLDLVGDAAGNCTAAGGKTTSTEPIAKQSLPISQSQIEQWKTEASSSEIWTGNYVIGIGATESFGPRKIDGSLRIRNNGTLIMTGTIWVTGIITIEGGATVKLDPNSYGSKSGVLIADPGRIIIENGAVLQGSGISGSYLMLLSTNSSQGEDDPAIFVKNNALGVILYTTQGSVTMNNNMKVREVTGYKLFLKNNAEIEYESGLIDALFTSGTGGSWMVSSWKEIE